MKPTCGEYLDSKLTVCRQPAVKKVEWAGCKFCGGGDCGDSAETEYLCAEHAEGEEKAVDLTEDDVW